MDFASRLRAMRGLRNISQEELARLTGISRVFISAFEKGVMPRPDQEARIRAALQWTDEMDQAFAILTGEELR